MQYFFILYEQQQVIRPIQGEVVCTDKAGNEYGVWGVYAKYKFKKII